MQIDLNPKHMPLGLKISYIFEPVATMMEKLTQDSIKMGSHGVNIFLNIPIECLKIHTSQKQMDINLMHMLSTLKMP